MELFLAGGIGAIVPSLIRLRELLRADPNVKTSIGGRAWIAIGLELALGVAAVWLLSPADPLSAAAIGYAGPEVLVGALKAAASKSAEAPPSTKGGILSGAGTTGRRTISASLLQWYRL